MKMMMEKVLEVRAKAKGMEFVNPQRIDSLKPKPWSLEVYY